MNVDWTAWDNCSDQLNKPYRIKLRFVFYFPEPGMKFSTHGLHMLHASPPPAVQRPPQAWRSGSALLTCRQTKLTALWCLASPGRFLAGIKPQGFTAAASAHKWLNPLALLSMTILIFHEFTTRKWATGVELPPVSCRWRHRSIQAWK